MLAWIIAHKTIEVSIMFLLSEALALIPSLKANSVFQLIVGAIQKEKAAEEAAQAKA